MPVPFPLLRLGVYGLLAVFSLIVLGIAGHITSLTSPYYYHSIAFLIFVSVFTLVVIGVFVTIDILRRGALTSRVWVEIIWTGLLWVFWLSGAAAVSALFPYTSCSSVIVIDGVRYRSSAGESLCMEAQAGKAFAWLAWILLSFIFPFLLITACVHALGHGHTQVWQAQTSEYPWFSRPSGTATGKHATEMSQPGTATSAFRPPAAEV